MPECDDGGGETEGYANRRAGCANYDGEITKRGQMSGRTRACTSDLVLIIVDYQAEKWKLIITAGEPRFKLK